MKVIFFLLFLLPPAAHSTCVSQKPVPFKTRTGLSASHDDSVVTILSGCGRCSGFVAEDGIVLTAAHCVPDVGKSVTVVFEDGAHRSFDTVYQQFDLWGAEVKDVALLKGFTGTAVAVPLAPMTEPGPCHLIGYGGPTRLQHTSLCASSGLVTDQGLIVGGQADHGDSGAPIFDERKRVMGLTEAIPHNGQAVIFAMPVDQLWEALGHAH